MPKMSLAEFKDDYSFMMTFRLAVQDGCVTVVLGDALGLDDAPTIKQVTEVFWSEEGENAGDVDTNYAGLPWRAVVQYEGGKFAYAEGDCDYTGFDCRGNGSLVLASSLETLLQFGVPADVRDLVLAEQNS